MEASAGAKKQKRGAESDVPKGKVTGKPAGVPGIAAFFTKKQPLSTPANLTSSNDSAATSKETSPSSTECNVTEKPEQKDLPSSNTGSSASCKADAIATAKAQTSKVPVHPLFLGAPARKAALQSASDGAAAVAVAQEPKANNFSAKQQDSSASAATAVPHATESSLTTVTASARSSDLNPEVVEIVDISSDDGDVIFVDDSTTTKGTGNRSSGAGVTSAVTSASAAGDASNVSATEKEVIEIASEVISGKSASASTASGKSGLFFLSKVSRCAIYCHVACRNERKR
jgi:hypothetical protein